MAECYFCGKRASQGEAAEAGWTQDFRRPGGERVGCEACPDCAAGRLAVGPDGELQLTDPLPPVAEAVRAVAARFFKFPMTTRGADSLDFHEVAVWELRDALTAAYMAGRGSK